MKGERRLRETLLTPRLKIPFNRGNTLVKAKSKGKLVSITYNAKQSYQHHHNSRLISHRGWKMLLENPNSHQFPSRLREERLFTPRSSSTHSPVSQLLLTDPQHWLVCDDERISYVQDFLSDNMRHILSQSSPQRF